MLSSTFVPLLSVLFVGVHGTKLHNWDPSKEGCQRATGDNYPADCFNEKFVWIAFDDFDDLHNILERERDCEIIRQEYSSMVTCKKVVEASNTVTTLTYIDLCVFDSKLSGINCTMEYCRHTQTKAEYRKTLRKIAKSNDNAVLLGLFLGFCLIFFSIAFLFWDGDDTLHWGEQIAEPVAAEEVNKIKETVGDDEDSGEETAIELESEDDTQSETEFDNSSSNSSFEVIAEEIM